MNREPSKQRSKVELIFAAMCFAIVAAFATAFAASFAGGSISPLIGIVLPAFVGGVAAFCLALWRFSLGESVSVIWQMIKDLWNQFGRY